MMTKKQDKVTKAGAVALEESQLDDAQGGVIAIQPASTHQVKIDFAVQKVADGSVKFAKH